MTKQKINKWLLALYNAAHANNGVSFTDKGTIVFDVEKLQQHMGADFKSWKTYQRSLNKYDFQKTERQKDSREFYHPLFKKDCFDLLSQIQRKKPEQAGGRGGGRRAGRRGGRGGRTARRAAADSGDDEETPSDSPSPVPEEEPQDEDEVPIAIRRGKRQRKLVRHEDFDDGDESEEERNGARSAASREARSPPPAPAPASFTPTILSSDAHLSAPRPITPSPLFRTGQSGFVVDDDDRMDAVPSLVVSPSTPTAGEHQSAFTPSVGDSNPWDAPSRPVTAFVRAKEMVRSPTRPTPAGTGPSGKFGGSSAAACLMGRFAAADGVRSSEWDEDEHTPIDIHVDGEDGEEDEDADEPPAKRRKLLDTRTKSISGHCSPAVTIRNSLAPFSSPQTSLRSVAGAPRSPLMHAVPVVPASPGMPCIVPGSPGMWSSSAPFGRLSPVQKSGRPVTAGEFQLSDELDEQLVSCIRDNEPEPSAQIAVERTMLPSVEEQLDSCHAANMSDNLTFLALVESSVPQLSSLQSQDISSAVQDREVWVNHLATVFDIMRALLPADVSKDLRNTDALNWFLTVAQGETPEAQRIRACLYVCAGYHLEQHGDNAVTAERLASMLRQLVVNLDDFAAVLSQHLSRGRTTGGKRRRRAIVRRE